MKGREKPILLHNHIRNQKDIKHPQCPWLPDRRIASFAFALAVSATLFTSRRLLPLLAKTRPVSTRSGQRTSSKYDVRAHCPLQFQFDPNAVIGEFPSPRVGHSSLSRLIRAVPTINRKIEPR